MRLLGEIGENHPLAMGPLMQLLRTTTVPEVLAEAQMALMRIKVPAKANPTGASEALLNE